ncbi:hypothetical protein ACXR2W_11640 [Leucobacter sp. HY1908]
MEDNTVNDNVTETQASAVAAETAPEKPVRKRASRRVTAPAGEAAAAVTVSAPAAEAAPAVDAAPAAAPAAEPAEAPKKRVSRARKKPVTEAADSAAEAAEAAPAATHAADTAAADQAADAPVADAPVADAPKKRVTRARKKVAEAPAADAATADAPAAAEAPTAAESASGADDATTEPEPVKKTRRARVTKAAKAEADAAQQAATADAGATGAPESVAAAIEAKLDEAAASSTTPEAPQGAEETPGQPAAETADSDKPARSRKRRGQKQDQADAKNGDAKNADAKSADAKNTESKNTDAKNGESKNGDAKASDGGNNGNDQHKQNDKNNDSRSSRTRQRDRKRRGQGDDFEPEITEDDVLLPIAGILDVLDNYAFVRTTGYLPGTSDVYVSLGQVKKYGMKRGDAIVGAIRQPREGEQAGRQKYNAIVKVDSINGRSLEENENREEFSELAAIYPERQLKLAQGAGLGAEIDAAAPVGLGQRGLLVVPKPARGVEVLSQIAAGVSANAPDAHLMLLLTNAQPEDITHLTRTVNGEVVAASFERPAEDQATVAELGIDRARRLAELGHDVVVLVDSVGDLARAYAQAQPVSARPAHGAIDDFAITQVRRVLGAARNAENAGSLTVLVTAATKTGVAADKQLLRELRTVANCEIRFAQATGAQLVVDAERSRTRGAAALQPTSAA